MAGCCQKEYNPLCGVTVWLSKAVRDSPGRVMLAVTMQHSGAIRSDVRSLLPFIERIFHLSICIQQVCPLRGQRMETNLPPAAMLFFRSVSLSANTLLLLPLNEMDLDLYIYLYIHHSGNRGSIMCVAYTKRFE